MWHAALAQKIDISDNRAVVRCVVYTMSIQNLASCSHECSVRKYPQNVVLERGCDICWQLGKSNGIADYRTKDRDIMFQGGGTLF